MSKKSYFKVMISEGWEIITLAWTKPQRHLEVVILIDNQVKPSALQQMVYKSNPRMKWYGGRFRLIHRKFIELLESQFSDNFQFCVIKLFLHVPSDNPNHPSTIQYCSETVDTMDSTEWEIL